MASITIRTCQDGTDSYRVLIRKKGVRMCKTFKKKLIALAWAKKNDPK
jgi:hypothetical protein